jgi:hypothetical protein
LLFTFAPERCKIFIPFTGINKKVEEADFEIEAEEEEEQEQEKRLRVEVVMEFINRRGGIT